MYEAYLTKEQNISMSRRITMKKTFILDEIDCANCAAKLEAAINKVEGVNRATVNFFAQKLILDVESEAVIDDVLAVCKKMEPDCEIK